jgi:hypothetical protein
VLFGKPHPMTFTTGFPGLPSSQRPKAAEHQCRAREFRASLRRKAQLKKAAEGIPYLPAPGESLHTLLTGYFDFALLLTCVLRTRPVPCEHARIATLSFGSKNTQEIARWLDEKLVGRLTLLCSDFMAKASPEVYLGAVKELVEQRGQIVGSARRHAKVVTMAFEDGLRLVFEGSANLRTNRNMENLCVVNDPALHDWHAAWIDLKVPTLKWSRIEVRTRIEEVFKLRLGGTSFADIVQYASAPERAWGSPSGNCGTTSRPPTS